MCAQRKSQNPARGLRDPGLFSPGPPGGGSEANGWKGYKNLYIDGGRTIQNFLRGDLIDEIILTRIPILLGGGSPLFDLLPKEIPFKLKSSEVLLGQMVKSHYVREG